jgi:hypothetical protein
MLRDSPESKTTGISQNHPSNQSSILKRQPIMIALTLLWALLICGCEVVFTHAPAGTFREDQAIVGGWINEKKEKEATTLRFDQGAGAEIKVSFLPADPDERNPVFTAKVLLIANHAYLVLNPTNEDKDKGFLIARYEITGDDLVVWLPNAEKFKALIKQKRIIGESESMGAVVTDSPNNITKLLASKDGDDAFEIFGKFRRIRR